MFFPHTYFDPAGGTPEGADPETEAVAPTPDKAVEGLTMEDMKDMEKDIKQKQEELKKLDITDGSTTSKERELVAQLQEMEYDLKMLELIHARREEGNETQSEEILARQQELLALLNDDVTSSGETDEYKRAKSVAAKTPGFSFTGPESEGIRELFGFDVDDSGEVKNYTDVADNVRAFQKWWNENNENDPITVDGIIGGRQTLPRIKKFMEANGEIKDATAFKEFAYAIPTNEFQIDAGSKQRLSEITGEGVEIAREMLANSSLNLPEGYTAEIVEEDDGSFAVVARNGDKSMVYDPTTGEFKEGESLIEPTETEQEWQVASNLKFGDLEDESDHEDGLTRTEWVHKDGFDYRKVEDGSIEKRENNGDGPSNYIERRDAGSDKFVDASEYKPSYEEKDWEKRLTENEGEWVDDPNINGDYQFQRVGDKIYAFPKNAEFSYDQESGELVINDGTEVLVMIVGDRTEEGGGNWTTLEDTSELDIPQDLADKHVEDGLGEMNSLLSTFEDADDIMSGGDELQTHELTGLYESGGAKGTELSITRDDFITHVDSTIDGYRTNDNTITGFEDGFDLDPVEPIKVTLTGDPATDAELIRGAQEQIQEIQDQQENVKKYYELAFETYQDHGDFTGLDNLSKEDGSRAKGAATFAKELADLQVGRPDLTDEQIKGLAKVYMEKAVASEGKIASLENGAVSFDLADVATYQVTGFASNPSEDQRAGFGQAGLLPSDTPLESRNGKVYIQDSAVEINLEPMHARLERSYTSEEQAKAMLTALSTIREQAPAEYSRAMETVLSNSGFDGDETLAILPELLNAGRTGLPVEVYGIKTQEGIRGLHKALEGQSFGPDTFKGLDPVRHKDFVAAVKEHSAGFMQKLATAAEGNEEFTEQLLSLGILEKDSEGRVLLAST